MHGIAISSIASFILRHHHQLITFFFHSLLTVIKDWKNPVRDTEEYRDSILEILSDARVVAPVIQMADLHSAIRQRSYFYVFAHQTTNGDYPQVTYVCACISRQYFAAYKFTISL